MYKCRPLKLLWEPSGVDLDEFHLDMLLFPMSDVEYYFWKMFTTLKIREEGWYCNTFFFKVLCNTDKDLLYTPDFTFIKNIPLSLSSQTSEMKFCATSVGRYIKYSAWGWKKKQRSVSSYFRARKTPSVYIFLKDLVFHNLTRFWGILYQILQLGNPAQMNIECFELYKMS